jgi:hypothetical protein
MLQQPTALVGGSVCLDFAPAFGHLEMRGCVLEIQLWGGSPSRLTAQESILLRFHRIPCRRSS